MPQLPTDRTAGNPDHVSDHNELHRLHNSLDGHLSTPHNAPTLTIQDDGSTIASGVTQLDFHGANIAASSSTGEVVVTVSLGEGSGLDAEAVQDTVATMIQAGTHLTKTYDDNLNTLTLAVSGLTTSALSDFVENVQDVLGGMVSGNTESGITVTYDDTAGKVNFSVLDAPTVAGNTPAQLRDRSTHTGSQTASTISDFTEAAQDVVGGMVTGNTESGITVDYDDNTGKLNFNVTAGGGTGITVQDENVTVGTNVGQIDFQGAGVTATAGSGEVIVTIPGAGLDPEEVQDVVGGMVSGNTESGVTVAYDDAGGKLNFTVTDSPTVAGLTPAQIRDRATHTGTQPASTISDLTETTQDIVGGMVAGNTETGISVDYDDSTGKLNFVVSGGGGSGSLAVQDEGASVTTGATQINFTGTGVAASAVGGNVTVSIPGAGSAVVTAWKDVTKDPYNAIGVGDETAKVQQAVDDASAASGDGIGVVFIPDRLINVNPISPKNNVWMIGGSWRAGLKLLPGAVGGAVNNRYNYQSTEGPISKFGVFNMQIDGNKANAPTGGGLKLYNTRHVIVSHCYVHDTAEGSIVVGDNTDNVEKVLITNNWVENAGVSSPANFWGMIATTSGQDIVIADNVCIGANGDSAYGVDIEPNASPWGANRRIVISGNTMRECRISVVAVQLSTAIEEIVIVGNTVNSINTAGGGAALFLQNITGPVLAANNFLRGPGHTSPAIYIDRVTNPLIIGNICTGMGVNQATYPNNVGIFVNNVTGGYITDNYIYATNPTHATAIGGIRETGTNTVAYGHNAMRNITNKGVYRVDYSNAAFTAANIASTATTLGFFGATPVTKPTALTASNASTVDTTYGTEEANVINNLRIRVNEIESKLRALGLLT